MKKLFLLGATALMASSLAASAATVTPLTFTDLPLKTVTFASGKVMPLTIGFGSGAYHRPGDPANVFYTISDRGPNIGCDDDVKAMTGMTVAELCGGDADGKIFPDTQFTPSIFRMQVEADNTVKVTETTPLRGSDGKLLDGLPNPLTGTTAETGFATDGTKIQPSTNGFDSEALVRLADGSYWISDEYGVSLAHVARDGKVLVRLVPAGLEKDYKGADYPVEGVLPAILAKRKLNRGIESIALAPDGSALYFAMQSPLANPSNDAYKKSRAIRIFKMDPTTQRILGEYIYELDDAASFKADNARKARKQHDVKVSEVSSFAPDQLIVLERISKTTKLYHVDLSKAALLPARFDAVSQTPTLEELPADQLAESGATPVTKSLILDSDNLPDMPEKIEGIATIDPSTLILTTDNDFGIEGAASAIVKVSLDKPLTTAR